MAEKKNTVNLRAVADRVGLAPCSVSAILNNTRAAQSIPQSTKDRVRRAAAEMNYRPNLWARSLRTKRTRMVAAVAGDFGRGEVARIVASAQRRLHQRGYFLGLGTVDFAETDALTQLRQRGIEGLIAIDAMIPREVDLPVALVELGYPTALDGVSEKRRGWLAALGEAAGETIIQQIEQQGMNRRIHVEAKIGPYFNVPASMLRAPIDNRESA